MARWTRRQFAAALAAGWTLQGKPLSAAGLPPVTFHKPPVHETQRRLIAPGSDEFAGEAEAMQIEARLHRLAETRSLPLAAGFQGSSPQPAKYKAVAPDAFEAEFGGYSQAFSAGLQQWLQSLGPSPTLRFFALPGDRVRFEAKGRGEYRTGLWEMRWSGDALTHFRPLSETRTTSAEPWFADATAELRGLPCFEQLARGVPYWRARLDAASGMDVYGNNGIAVGDCDQDGTDEVYVCQPGGLPNRLLKRHQGGTWQDLTEPAGVGVLDNTSAALFVDFRNTGQQDLVVLTTEGPLYFLNEGGTRFRHVPNAFRFPAPPQGTFTGMSAADFDRDGKVDLYLCTYSYFQSEDRYRYPAPYHDAQNGPPNFLFRNRLTADGQGFFEDVTPASGLQQNNSRYSFAPAWCDYDGDGWPDLYVANDFGRNNLYKNDKGRFQDIAAAAGVEDLGPGMSTCWFDANGDARPDLYIANMWSAAGQRVVADAHFGPKADGTLADAYRRHTEGNSLYEQRENGTFADTGAAQGVEMGRWAWSADAFDADNDGAPELGVTCGMISNPSRTDLMSYFWRQVVAKSPVTETSAPAYETGWNVLNQWIREDLSWSGHEPNVLYARRNGRYYDFSGVSGFDFAQDGRAFAVTDFDNTGHVEVLLKSRTGPQIRLLRSRAGQGNHAIRFALTGTRSNRDAIGARVELHWGNQRTCQFLQAGSGYLSQHSKRLHFGLGPSTRADKVTVHWPSGVKQEWGPLEASFLHHLTEGSPDTKRTAFATAKSTPLPAIAEQNDEAWTAAWLLQPVPLPDRQAAGFLFLSDGSAQLPGGVPGRVLDLRTAPADTVAAYSLFRRYLFDRRSDQAAPLLLLVDEQSRAHKVYQQIPDAATLRADLRLMREPNRQKLALPFPGRYYTPPARNHYRLGAAFLGAGYPDQAVPYLREALRQWPENVKALLALGQIHLEGERPAEAKPYLAQAAQLSPRSPEVWNHLGGVAMAEAQYKQALDYFEKALALSPDLPYALANAGQAQARLGRAREAEALFRRTLRLDTSDAETADRLGLLLAQQGRTAEAKALFQQALERQPRNVSAINNLGVLYLQTGQAKDAIAAFQYGLRVDPGHDMLAMNLARVYVGLGQRDKAREVLRTLLDQRPGSETARRALRELGEP